MQLTSLSAVRNLTYLFKNGLIYKGAIKEPIKRNKIDILVCTSGLHAHPNAAQGAHV